MSISEIAPETQRTGLVRKGSMEHLFVDLSARESARTFYEEAGATYTRQQMTTLINPIMTTELDEEDERGVIKY